MPDEHDDLWPLLDALRQRDEGAARVLVERLGPLVLRIVRAHRPRRVAEEDLCQEVFMNVFASLERYRGTVPLEHWVSRVAVNVCVSAARRETARPELRWADLSTAEAAAAEVLLSDSADEAQPNDPDASAILHRLLDTLPPRDRALMQWLGVEEQRVEDVAARLGWSRVQVKVTAFRIRLRLRAAAKKLMQEGNL
ncbi:MAG: RNA polymerase sigma factor [Roseimicrobium sp.]